MEQLQGYFWGFRIKENPNIPFSYGATEQIRPLSLLVTLPSAANQPWPQPQPPSSNQFSAPKMPRVFGSGYLKSLD